jgi:hypothetical protein
MLEPFNTYDIQYVSIVLPVLGQNGHARSHRGIIVMIGGDESNICDSPVIITC